LRFFTVYGPWGRPDMAMYLFTKAIVEGRPIKLFNHGKMRRDFTHIGDIVHGVLKLVDLVPQASVGPGSVPARLYNIGNNKPEELLHVVSLLEQALGREARTEMLPMQPGDVLETFADIEELTRDTGFRPSISIEDGVGDFVAWYREHHNV
jgi:UDP-glucuronate 4-epimerase